MNITDLIADLNEAKEAHGDLEIRVWADHGQYCTKAYSITPQWVDEEGSTYAEEDLVDYDEGELTQVLEIAG